MEEYAFATRTSAQNYEYFFSSNLEEFYQKVRIPYFPIRERFNAYLKQAYLNPEKYLIITAPEPEDDYLEVILGNSRAVIALLMEAHIKELQQTSGKLKESNEQARNIIEQIAEGIISPAQLKAVKDKIKV